MIAWHFLPDHGRLNHTKKDRKMRVGQTVRVKGPVKLCLHGLHASERIIDALRYSPGSLLCLVRVGGEIVRYSDKLAGTERTILAMADAAAMLRRFACDVAWRALNAERAAGREPDKRSWDAVRVARRFLAGNAAREELARAARAAVATARAAAARAAAAAARAAAAAARAAEAWAWAAAAAAWTAEAEIASQNTLLERRALKLLGITPAQYRRMKRDAEIGGER